ncbi:proton channel OTOP1 isoform X2 [Paroedura picta]|uniref:proton channel OTOP1 isoform X2 n=1 Tax=Paroedura picta TaxID=143630 RepID=UPI004056A031
MAAEGGAEGAARGPRGRGRAADEWELQKAAERPPPVPCAPCAPCAPRRGYPQKNAEILSSQYGLNLFLAGLVLMFAWAVHAAGLAESAVLAYLVTLMLVQLVWMAWYVCRRAAQKRLIQEKDTHAGARWLKGGITLFAMITLIMDSFKIGYFVGYSDCLSIAEGIFPVTHAVHTLVQVYFLWCYAKDIIQSFKTLERFGVIHSVFTNLLLWTNAVLAESKHQLNEHKERLITLGFGNISIVLYVLWKNIGRNVEHLQHHKIPFRFQGKTLGTIVGMVVFATTVAVVVVYLIQIGRSKLRSEIALMMFYLYAIVVLTLMCAAGIVALLIYRLEGRSLDVSKNPARKLDGDLLVGTASGSWLLSWGSILAIICAETHPAYAWYNLPYSILVIIEKYVQNLFIIESIHREHEKGHDDIKTLRILTVSNGSTLSPAPSYKEIYSGAPGMHNGALPCKFSGSVGLPESNDTGAPEEEKGEGGKVFPPPPPDSSYCRRSFTLSKRRILKNVAAFLFLCNLSLWIPAAFGCRPEYDNGLEEMVFGFEPWIIIVNLAMPFSIFYRMHSAASLFEVSCIT